MGSSFGFAGYYCSRWSGMRQHSISINSSCARSATHAASSMVSNTPRERYFPYLTNRACARYLPLGVCTTPRRPVLDRGLHRSRFRLLPRDVMGRRWSGLTHLRLWHLWSSIMPSGIGPARCAYAQRCALISFPLSAVKWPYPHPITAPVQFQHVSVFSTLAQNRSSSVPFTWRLVRSSPSGEFLQR